jgi:signal transduction histidine kinase
VLSRKAELVKAQHDELNTMMDELGAMVYVADMETYDILAANRPLMELYGEDAVGRKCYETLQSGRKSPCDFCTNKFLVEEGKPKDAHIRKFRNSLTGRWYQCLDKAIRWTNGRLVRLEIALDVTELESARERLDLMTAQFSLYNSLLVHDISNHASSAKGFIHILRDPDAPEERRGAMAENALVQIGKIETLVDRVSKIVKAEAVGTEEMSETELGTLLDEAIADTQAVSEFANVEFRKEYRASGCRVRLGEFGHDIFLNLLTNAAKYGGGRPVTVKVEESTLDGEPAWRVCVTDQGCGIPDDKKGLMFEQYERLPTLSQIKGLGLGLTIVRTLTHAYGGNVGLEDRVEGDHTKGSVFSVAFPKIGP